MDHNNIIKNNENNGIIDNKSTSLRKWIKLENNYYNSFKDDNEINENGDFNDINYNISILNTRLIFSYYEIYNAFIRNNVELYKHDIKLEYKLFIIFIRNNFANIILNYGTIVFFKKCKKCYNLINCIFNKEYKNDKVCFINFLCKFKLSVDILYKLNKACIDEFKIFFKEKFEISITTKKSKINHNGIIDIYDNKVISKICRNIPLTYLGSKRNSINKIITKLLNCKNVNCFVDLFGGSLLPGMNIIIYENDRLLNNFYNILKTKYNDFILKLKNILKEMNLIKNKKDYVQKFVFSINNNLISGNTTDKILVACYFLYIK